MLVLKNEPYTLAYTRILHDINKVLSHGSYRLYLLLASYAFYDKIVCFPSREKLAERLGVNIKTVTQWSNKLQEIGLIKKWQRGVNQSNNYEFQWNDELEKLFPLPDDFNRSYSEVTPGSYSEVTLNTKDLNIKDIIQSSTSEGVQSMNVKKVNPIEYRFLKLNQKLHSLTCYYVTLCTNQELYTNKRPSKVYYSVRSFLKKKPETELGYLWDYLYTIEQNSLMSMTEFYNSAISWRDKQNEEVRRQETLANQPAEQYKEISVESFL